MKVPVSKTWFGPKRIVAGSIKLTDPPKGNFLPGRDGIVTPARLRFHRKDGTTSRHWVAVKTFHVPLTDAQARVYQRGIWRLRRFGVRLPKMAMAKIKLEGESKPKWVQIAQLFGSASRPKVGGTVYNLGTIEKKIEAAKEFAKVVNAGFNPYTSLMQHFTEKPVGAIPLDLEALFFDYVEGKRKRERATKKSRVKSLCICLHSMGASERAAIAKAARQTLAPELRPLFDALWKTFKSAA